MPSQARPLLRVILEPLDPTNQYAVDQLEKGLKLLDRGDPFVEIKFLKSGENMIGAIGELHLERCLKDLKESLKGIWKEFQREFTGTLQWNVKEISKECQEMFFARQYQCTQ